MLHEGGSMNVDIESVKQVLGTLSGVLGILKQAKELLPENSNKKEIIEALDRAERQLRVAESQAAQGLGYELCRNHFPPEIMLSSDNMHWKCPVCGTERDTSAASPSDDWNSGLRRKSRWEVGA